MSTAMLQLRWLLLLQLNTQLSAAASSSCEGTEFMQAQDMSIKAESSSDSAAVSVSVNARGDLASDATSQLAAGGSLGLQRVAEVLPERPQLVTVTSERHGEEMEEEEFEVETSSDAVGLQAGASGDLHLQRAASVIEWHAQPKQASFLLATHELLKSDSESGRGTAESDAGYSETFGSALGQRVHVSLKKHRVRVVLKGEDGGSNAKVAIQHKTSYYGEVCVGSPSQCFTVVYDTGSGNLILPGKDCKSSACTMHRSFDMGLSRSAREVSCDGLDRKVRNRIRITFGTGEITGSCVQDRLCVGSACSRGDFITTDYESSMPFSMFNFDGVQGLALEDMSQGKRFNLMFQMTENLLLKQPVFAVFLSDSDEEESMVTFGDMVPERMSSEMFWQDVTRHSGYWEVQIGDITINNRAQNLCKDCFVAVDTGTSELAGPTQVIDAMKRLLDVKEDCSNYHSLPHLGFSMGKRILNLHAKDYVDKSDSSCEVAFMGLDVPPPNGPLFVLGIPFLQKFYTAYDRVNRKVGFAVAKHSDRHGDHPEPSSVISALIEN